LATAPRLQGAHLQRAERFRNANHYDNYSINYSINADGDFRPNLGLPPKENPLAVSRRSITAIHAGTGTRLTAFDAETPSKGPTRKSQDRREVLGRRPPSVDEGRKKRLTKLSA
jgi:hypothetical protein